MSIEGRAALPGGIDDRVMELGQEGPVVQVSPRVEVAPMVGGDGVPSTPRHPAAPENEANWAGEEVAGSRRRAGGARLGHLGCQAQMTEYLTHHSWVIDGGDQ